jgi:hypothetical protein
MEWKPLRENLKKDLEIYLSKENFLKCFNNPEIYYFKRLKLNYWYIKNWIIYEDNSRLYLHILNRRKYKAQKELLEKCNEPVDTEIETEDVEDTDTETETELISSIKQLSISSSERQGHGFDYENKVILKYGLKKSNNYTSVYDAYTKLNIPVQIKCIKNKCAVEMGDYLRNKNKKEDFILIVGFWDGQKDNIINEVILYIKKELFIQNLKFNLDDDMFKEMSLISNLKKDDNRWREFRIKFKNEWDHNQNKIDLRCKRDHKTQRRIQCAISWKNFNEYFIKNFDKYKLIK